MINARWGVEGNADSIAVALPAYQFQREGNIDLSGYRPVTENLENLDRWYVETPDGQIVSNRAPGLIALVIPSYIVFSPERFSLAPATLVAVGTSVLAVVITWRVLIGLIGLQRATVAALTLALGTTTWWVSSSELWPHGPGQLWAALAASSMAGSSYLGAGAAFAMSVTTRPLTGIFAFVTGVSETWRLRKWKPALVVGAVSAIGVAAVAIYNWILFESWNLRGGYGEDFASGALERFSVSEYLVNVWEMFLGIPNGFLTTTPILLLALYGAVRFWRDLPGWSKSLACAALGYLLVHAALNRASGGSLVFYRYPLESIVLATPLLALGASHLWDLGREWKVRIRILVAVSIGLQFAHVFIFSCHITDPVVSTCLL